LGSCIQVNCTHLYIKIGVCFVLHVCLFICDHILTFLNYAAPCCIFWYYWKTLNKAMCTLVISQNFNQDFFLLNLDFHWKLNYIYIFSTNQCLFISYKEMHLLFHVMGKCMGILHWPSSYWTISINQCIFMLPEENHSSRGEIHGESPIGHHIYHYIINIFYLPFHIPNLDTWGQWHLSLHLDQ
jgi:hypothetical protein